MSIMSTITTLTGIGRVLTLLGALMSRLGEALAGPNLGPAGDRPIEGSQEQSQDPLAPDTGAENEEPEEQASFSLFEVDSSESTRTERSMLRSEEYPQEPID